MTKSLESLSVELRKAAVTINQVKDIYFQEMIEKKISEKEYSKKVIELMNEELWMPYEKTVGLMRRIKTELKKELAASSEYDHDLKADVIKTKTALRKVEEVLG